MSRREKTEHLPVSKPLMKIKKICNKKVKQLNRIRLNAIVQYEKALKGISKERYLYKVAHFNKLGLFCLKKENWKTQNVLQIF